MRTHVWLGSMVVVVACGSEDPGATGAAGAGAGVTSSTSGSGASSGTAGNTGPSVGGSSGGGSASGGAGAGGDMQACPAQAYAPGEFAETIMFDGNTREYEVQVPASYDNSAPIPVVFDLHGLGSNSGQQQLISGWQALAEANGFAVVRPNGFGAIRSWNGGDTCCGTALSQNLDDVGLMKAILAEVKSQLCVDDKHVYASGLSNGGAMSHRLACDAPDVFAAVAPVSYPIAYLPISKCQPSQPVGVMHSHGTGDLTVNYNGGLGVASAPASFAQWGSNNNCVGDPVETFSMGASHCDTYENCDGGVEVTLCTINGPHILYNNNDNVKIAELAWAFFQKHSLP